MDRFDFSVALRLLIDGRRVKRDGWDEFLFLVNGSTFKVNRPPLLGIYEEGTEINYGSHIDIRNEDGTICPWVPTQRDLLADDWMISS